MRYAMDISKIKSELGWTPKETFKTGLKDCKMVLRKFVRLRYL